MAVRTIRERAKRKPLPWMSSSLKRTTEAAAEKAKQVAAPPRATAAALWVLRMA